MYGYNSREQTLFIGVVEDRNDPLKARRVRVRCFFIHPENKTHVPTEHLPWARVATKITLKEGDHVRGYFEDGPDMQLPVITEQIIGIPEKTNQRELGFNDPRTDEQLQNAPRPPKELKYSDSGSGVQIVEQDKASPGYRLNEPISTRLIRGEFLTDYNNLLKKDLLTDYPVVADSVIRGVVNSTLIQAQQYLTSYLSGLLNKIPGLSPYVSTIVRNFFTSPYFQKYTLQSTYSVPPSKAAPKYPYNNAVVSESGHIQEVDDTPGAERIHTRHRSGTYEEYYPDGDYVQHVRKDNHQIVDGQDTCIVRGKKQIVVEGSDSVTIRGARYIQVEGTSQIVVLGDANISVQGNATQYVKGNFEQVIGGNFNQTVNGNYTQVVNGTTSKTYKGTLSEKFEKDYKQNIVGEWTFRFEDAAFRFQFLGAGPITSTIINQGTVILEPIQSETGNQSALNGAEFSITPTVTSEALERAKSSTDPANIDMNSIQYDTINVVDNSGMYIV